MGWRPNSFFLLKSSKDIKRSVTIIGKPQDQLGIIVEIEDKNLSYDMEKIIEKEAIRSINYISGVRAFEIKRSFYNKNFTWS